MGLEEGCEDQGLHGHQLDEDVQRWARSVLQRVTDGVTNDGRLVRVGALASQGARVLGSLSLFREDAYSSVPNSGGFCFQASLGQVNYLLD